MALSDDVQRLKDEGNALFAQKKYREAAASYSAAIELSPENAVLWSNRAACALNTRSYLEAASDAEKATELDPSFARGWARLATARQQMSSWLHAIEAWKRALSSLPQADLSPGEQQQKAEYEGMLESAERTLEEKQRGIREMGKTSSVNNLEGGKMPWERAEGMRAELMAGGQEGMFSSAWLVLSAYSEWAKGVEIMNGLRKHTVNGQPAMTGGTGAIERLSNAVMRDKRVFHIADPEFMIKYNDQMMYEAHTRHAWTKGGADVILTEVQQRLSRSNWSAVRPALSVTVRGYIMRAFLTAGLMNDDAAAVAFYNDAIDILDRGKVLWADVPDEERGVIFSKTFIRGVKALRLECFMTAYKGGNKGSTLKRLKRLAEELVADVTGDPPDPTKELDPGFALAFYNYPLGEGLAMLALHDMELARQSKTPEDEKKHLALAAAQYADAAVLFPPDDEMHSWFLNSALGAYWQCATPLRVTLPIMEKLKTSVPQMKRIWEHSQLALGGRDKVLQKTLWFEEDVQSHLREGKIKLDDPIVMGGPDDPRQVR